MRHLVGNQRVVVNVLMLVGYHASIALALGTFAREGQVEPVAGDAVVQGDDVMVDATVALLVDIDIAYPYVLMVGFFHTIQVKRRILADIGLNDLCGQEVAVVGCMVAE